MSSIETRTSWVVAFTALVIMSIAYGAPFVAVVALKPIAAELGSERSVPALAYSLAWLGAAWGGIAMGRIADRVGVKWTVAFGAAMIGVGLAVSAGGSTWRLWVGHGLFIGLLGNAGINAPCYIYVSRWFDRRRGTALALISSGQYVAGAIWPTLFERGIALCGWRDTMLLFGAVVVLTVAPLALLILRAPPETGHATLGAGERARRVLGLPPNLVLGLLAVASFMCCVPMAMPQGHLVALCSDRGIPASHGAIMLSVLLGCAFASRQFWGWLSDRIGGLRTVLSGSLCQLVAMLGFLLVKSEAGLFVVATFFGLGFSGMIPAYVLAVRELFPAAEAAWRVPTLLLFSGSGMAAGGWLAGFLYDRFGFYGAAFLAGLVFNVGNLLLVGALVVRRQRQPRAVLA
ncbi:MAG TPA: MFS transporter [Acetobacteraceae bacterium]|jgi:MFS family permease